MISFVCTINNVGSGMFNSNLKVVAHVVVPIFLLYNATITIIVVCLKSTTIIPDATQNYFEMETECACNDYLASLINPTNSELL